MDNIIWAKTALVVYFTSRKARLISVEQFQQAVEILKRNNIKIYVPDLVDVPLLTSTEEMTMAPSLKAILISREEYLASKDKENILKID